MKGLGGRNVLHGFILGRKASSQSSRNYKIEKIKLNDEILSQ